VTVLAGVFAEVQDGRLARRNPVAKLLAVTVLTLALVVSLDVVTPSLVLLATLLAIPWTGVRVSRVAGTARLLLLSAVTVGLTNAVFGSTKTGDVLLGPITTGSAQVGLAIGLRVVALGLPGILVVAATDPVDLADSLVQQLHLPAKFAYGTLAALRLLPLLAEEWETLTLARRARGVDAGRNPVARLAQFAGQVLSLLVAAVRRGIRLATAMDARGFDSGSPRTAARQQAVSPADIVLVLAAAAVAVGAVVTSVLLGSWRPLVGG
jgi:energy-coupling factor transport system permease protein